MKNSKRKANLGQGLLRGRKEALNGELKEKLGQPQFVIEQMAQYMKDGDVASITDLISSYIANSSKYKNQEQFASAIGTTHQALHRMLSHSGTASMKVFFKAIEQIHADASGKQIELID